MHVLRVSVIWICAFSCRTRGGASAYSARTLHANTTFTSTLASEVCAYAQRPQPTEHRSKEILHARYRIRDDSRRYRRHYRRPVASVDQPEEPEPVAGLGEGDWLEQHEDDQPPADGRPGDLRRLG